jgi:hypothetical protein
LPEPKENALTYDRDAHGRPGLYLDVVGPDGLRFARNVQPEDINRDPELYTKTDVPGFVRQIDLVRKAERELDEKVTYLTGESEHHIEEQLGRLQQTINAMLRRLPPEELDALLVAVRGYA